MHVKIFQILTKRGVHGNVLNCLKLMYSQLKSSLRVENKISIFFPCNVGTRPGDISSPFIFLLFIQELSTLLKEKCQGIFITDQISPVQCILYADDVAHCADKVNNLQQQLNCISNLRVNMQKN